MTSRDIHAEIADRIATMLEGGVAPWRQPWSGGCGMPSNASTARPYTGISCLLLHIAQMRAAYTSARWLTFKQAKALGGHVRKGERGTRILIVRVVEKKAKKAGEDPEQYRMARSATVFNVDQCEGLPAESDQPEFCPLEAAEDLVSGYLAHGPRLVHGELGGAWYRPSDDTIGMPRRSAFHSAAGYYATLFHEVGHSTGHASRLDRDLSATAKAAHHYAREELVAEFAAAFLCGHAGLDDDRELESRAAYLAGWAARIREEPEILAWAASQAQKAVDLVLEQRGAAAIAA